jgi:hypothetical protein
MGFLVILIVKVLINQYKRWTRATRHYPSTKRVARETCYDGRNPPTLMSFDASHGGTTISMVRLAWLAAVRRQ